MAIRKLDKVYCSLNLGYVYNISYSFQPQVGVRISVFFINDKGVYNTKILSPQKKTQIKIGSAVFNMYPVNWEKTQSGTQKTFKVDFIDDTIKLKNYYIALTGKGCGTGVFQLGKVVDNRTDAEKGEEDPDLFAIKKFTQDSDLEYSFGEFLAVLRKVFPVKTSVQTNDSVTRPFAGTFEEVLGAWCSYFNYSYFFENGSLVIFDPTSLNIVFPSIPDDAIESSESESIENTYDKTVWNNFYQDGGEINIGTSESDGLFISNESLEPWENIFDVKNINTDIYGSIDKNQVAAAQYGKEFWFLYNYYKGTEASVCGFDRYAASPSVFASVADLEAKKNNAVSALGTNTDIASFNEDLFNRNFAFYYNYGRNVAGRYYVSNQKLGLGTFSLYQWYDQNEFTSFTIEDLLTRNRIDAKFFLKPVNADYGFIKESVIEGFNGIALNGQRIYIRDDIDRDFDTYFSLSVEQKQEIDGYYAKILGGSFGSGSILWSDGSYRNYIVYEQISLSSSIINLLNETLSSKVGDENSVLNYRYKNFQMKGYFTTKINNSRINESFNSTDVAITNQGPQVNSNTSIIKVKRDSEYVAYFAKYNSCNSASTDNSLLNRRFESITPSIDIPIPVETTKSSNGVVTIGRNLTYVNKYKESGILGKFAKSFAIPEKRLSFTLNYFYNSIPTSFISNGLIGLSLNISENGLSASYSYSNEMLRVPFSPHFIEQLERNMKLSWTRQYNPQKQASI